MSIARRILREKEAKGELIPYVRESGFVVYTTPAEIHKREGGVPIMISDALEEVASSVSAEPVITEEMDLALVAAGTPGAVKPSKLAWKRREAGEKKSRKDTRPEIIVEPLEGAPMRSPEAAFEPPKAVTVKETPSKKAATKKEEKPKKEAPKKKAATKKEEKPKKEASKKEAAKKEEKPKKEASKKEAAKKEEKPKKEASKKAATKKEEKPKKEASKKEAAKKEEKPKKEASKKEAAKKEEKPKKETAKKEEKPKKAASKKKTE